MSSKRPKEWLGSLLRHTVLLAVSGLILLLLGVAMLRDGRRHEASYREFQQCMTRQQTTVCVLADAGSSAGGSARLYRANYERQLTIGWGAVCGGAVALVLAGLSLILRRRSPQPGGVVPRVGELQRNETTPEPLPAPTAQETERRDQEHREWTDAREANDVARELERVGSREEAVQAYLSVIDRFRPLMRTGPVPERAPAAWGEVWRSLRECEDLLRELGRDEEADTLFEIRLAQAERRDPPDDRLIAILLYDKAEKAYLRGRYDDAVRSCRRMQARYRDRPEFAFDLLRAYLGECEGLAALGHHTEALSLACEATAFAGPLTAPGLTFRLHEVRCLNSLGRAAEAINACDSIVDAYHEVSSRQDSGSYDDAYPLQSRAAEAMVIKADILAGQGHRAEALAIYKRVASKFEYAHAESSDVEDERARRWASEARQRVAALSAESQR